MATEKQKKAVDKLVENGGNVSKAMKAAGYTDATAKTPQKLTESKGFKELLEEYGLTDQLIVTALVDDIKSKPGQRVQELTLASKITGIATDKIDLTSGGAPLKALVEFADGNDKDNAS